MFVGHIGAAFAAKRIAPRASLGALVLATMLPDLVWDVLLLIGAEHVRIEPGATRVVPLSFVDYPISHSLLGVLALSAIAGLLFLRFTFYRRGAWVVAALVTSHFILDVVSHVPDLPLLFSGPYLGLGLYRSLPGTVFGEGLIFAAGVWLYVRGTLCLDGIGRHALWATVLFLGLLQVASYFGPPPPNVRAIAYVGLSQLLFVLLASWIDRHREPAYDLTPLPRLRKAG
jgi:hypothetical protein